MSAKEKGIGLREKMRADRIVDRIEETEVAQVVHQTVSLLNLILTNLVDSNSLFVLGFERRRSRSRERPERRRERSRSRDKDRRNRKDKSRDRSERDKRDKRDERDKDRKRRRSRSKDRSEKKRDRKDKDREERRKDRGDKERKPEMEIKIKEEPVDGELLLYFIRKVAFAQII